MSEHDETLRKALEENARLRSEREGALREAASSEFSGRVRFAERVYWVYAIICIAVGVSAYNEFAQSFDVKTLLTCAVVLLVVYETTVLLKLWFAVARMKMDVLKDVKLLRLEVAQIAAATGVENPSEPSTKYEPMRGVSWWERKLWLAVCIVAAVWVSTSWHNAAPDMTELASTSQTVLAADGSATVVSDVTKTHSTYMKRSTTYHAPKDQKLRWLDPQGHELPVEVHSQNDTHNRYDIEVNDAAIQDGRVSYTRVAELPQAATEEGDVWTYATDIEYGNSRNNFTETVLLPERAELISANPTPTVTLNEGGRTAVRFHGKRDRNEKFSYSVRYRLTR